MTIGLAFGRSAPFSQANASLSFPTKVIVPEVLRAGVHQPGGGPVGVCAWRGAALQ